jgi:replicative DNA helicase
MSQGPQSPLPQDDQPLFGDADDAPWEVPGDDAAPPQATADYSSEDAGFEFSAAGVQEAYRGPEALADVFSRRDPAAVAASGFGGRRDRSDASYAGSDRGSSGRGGEAGQSGARGRRGAGAQADTTDADGSPPCDLVAERALLASCMLDEMTIAVVQGQVTPEDFYDPRHTAIFRVMQTLAASGRGVDPVTVHGLVSSDPAAAQVGEGYLTDLVVQSAGNPQNAGHYAERIGKLGRMRRILAATHKLSAEGYKRGTDPDQYVDLVQDELNKALAEVSRGGPVHIGEVVGNVFGEVLAARERGSEVVGISTGFREIDQRLLGLHRTDLLVLAARPAMGKTAFALTLALNVAQKQRRDATEHTDRHTVVVFSLEMGRDQLAARLLSQHARVPNTQMRKGEIGPDDEHRLREAAAELSELKIFLDDSGTVTPQDVRSRCKQLAMQYGQLDLVVIDYLQLMSTTGGPKQSREQQVSEVSRSMKALAKEMRCTVLALSQLNRGVEQRADKRPMMSDLRESGAIEQDADIIAFIYRDWVYNKDAPEHLAELIIAKQRAGQTGTIQMHFDGSLTRFANLDHRANDSFAYGQ